MTTDFRALCAELLAWAERTSAHYVAPPDVIIRTRAALSAPEQGPTDEDLIRTYQSAYEPAWKRGEYHGCHVDGLRAVLARCGRPAVEPVPVAERLPGPEDCDDQGRCWLGTPGSGAMDAYWVYRTAATRTPKGRDRKPWETHWAPHWALPVPQEGADGQH